MTSIDILNLCFTILSFSRQSIHSLNSKLIRSEYAKSRFYVRGTIQVTRFFLAWSMIKAHVSDVRKSVQILGKSKNNQVHFRFNPEISREDLWPIFFLENPPQIWCAFYKALEFIVVSYWLFIIFMCRLSESFKWDSQLSSDNWIPYK